MTTIVAALGILIAILGLIGLVRPGRLVSIGTSWRGMPRFLAAVAIRLVAGAVCLLAAPQARSPLVLQIVGFVSILIGLVTLLLGRQRMESLIDWAIRQPPGVIRVLSFLTIAFGALLAYVAI